MTEREYLIVSALTKLRIGRQAITGARLPDNVEARQPWAVNKPKLDEALRLVNEVIEWLKGEAEKSAIEDEELAEDQDS